MIVAHNLHGFGNGGGDAGKMIAPPMTGPRAVSVNHAATFSKGRRGIKGLLVANATLTPIEEEMRKAAVARDYDKLFSFAPPKSWAYDVPLGKYSFVESGGRRIYKPFSRADISKFIYSPYMTVAPGWTCSDAQKEAMVAHYLKASNTHVRKFPTTEPAHIFPIFPGRNICFKEPRSTWDKLKPIAIIATVAVGGVFLGKALMAKTAASGAAKAAAAKGAIVGAGSKAGAATAASLATKAGTAAALKTGAGIASATAAAASGVASAATSAGGIIGAAAKAAPYATKIINGASTVRALADGELPPPPISLGDGSLTDYANLVGEKLAERELGKKMSEQEAIMLKQLIERERMFLARDEITHAPIVNPNLNPALTAAQETRADGATSEFNLVKALAVGVPLFLLAKGA